MYKVIQGVLIAMIILGSGWLSYDLYTNKPVIVEETSEEEVQENTEENLVERWQTYRNEEYEFEIRYPSEFNTEKQEPVIYSGYDVESLSNDFKFVIKHPDNPQNLILRIAVSSREFLESQSGSITEPPVPSLEKWDLEKEFLAGNSKGVECSFLLTGQNICRIVEKNGITMLDRIKLWPPGGDAGRYLTFYSDKFRYDIIIFSSEIWDILPYGSEFSFDGIDNPSQDSFIQLSNQILSTFKFIEPTDTSDWRTYRNEEFGFSFEYPEAWGAVENDVIDNYWYSPSFTNSDVGFGVVTASYWPSKDPNFGRGGTQIDTQGFEINDAGNIDFIRLYREGEIVRVPAGNDYAPIEGKNTIGVINENLIHFGTMTIHVVFNTRHDEVTAINIFGNLNDENLDIIKRIASTFKLIESADTSSWQTYRNEEFGFKINHPQGYAIREGHKPYFDEARGYKKSELLLIDISPPIPRGDASRWGILVYEGYRDADETINLIASRIGLQWADRGRGENRTQITINSIPATLVIVTTTEYETWISENVIFESNGKIYKIGNGAVEDSEFEKFYISFKPL